MGLLESGLLREANSRQLAFFNAIPERFAQVFLQCLEFHGRSIARAYSIRICATQVQHLQGNKILDLMNEQLYAAEHL